MAVACSWWSFLYDLLRRIHEAKPLRYDIVVENEGLSMTKWKPIEYKYPENDDQWSIEFDHYKQFPEYKHAPHEVTLQKFKRIYTVEYIHRISGSTLGAIFLLPLATFTSLGWIKPKFTKRLGLIGSLGLL